MTTYFVDTSALFKRYLPERGSELSNLQRLRSADKVISDGQLSEAWAAFSPY